MIYEILCNGKVHYTRPEGHPDIAEALALIEWHKKISGVSSYEVRPTPLAPDLVWVCGKCKTHNADGVLLCGFCDTPRLSG